jgi:predicted Rossmann fold nucleotide-binding protein DprA/Smf involved in DNA uptake
MGIVINFYGNKEIWNLERTAFFCSQKCPATVILKVYDWAIEQRDKGVCIISGFHTKIEKDVLNFLLKGNQPVIYVLARGLMKTYEPEHEKAVKENRLLFVSPFTEKQNRVTQALSNKRNDFIIEHTKEIYIAYASENGNLETLVKQNINNRNFKTMNIPENERLIKIGANTS